MAVSDLLPCSSVDVEGVFVGTLSPIKSSRSRTDTKYYDGSISDGVKTVRFVSFEPKLRKQIEEAYDNNYGVSLSNCAVKRGRNPEGDLEVLVSSKMRIVKSPKKFKIDRETKDTGMKEMTSLELLKDVSEHERVTVKGKVIEVSPVENNG